MHEFLQSPVWELFQQSLGRQTTRLSNGALCIRVPLPLGLSYLYIPRADIQWGTNGAEVMSIARTWHSIFIRYEPISEYPAHFTRVKHIQPSHTLVLDLHKSEAELLTDMHPKTRYNIRLAQRKGVVCERVGREGFEIFWQLIANTYERKGKRTYPRSYYEQLLRIPGMLLYVARVEGVPIVANLVLWSDDVATYVHGGSDDHFQSTMAPQLLQWYQIQAAKQAGMSTYDLWGIDEQYGAGIARFKRGFGGTEVRYPGTFELPVRRKLYAIYRLLKRLIT